jgi:lactoylglutathione lyase
MQIMKKSFRTLIFASSILLIACSVNAQTSDVPHVNHLAIYVVDLQKSANFYEKIMELKKIEEPFHDGKHVWLKMGEHCQLHIISGAGSDIPHDINIHLAFSIPSLEEFIKHLKAENIKFGNWAQNSETPQVRADGIKQIYLQDPDGYWIEVNNDKF